jgi:hypothetical protein
MSTTINDGDDDGGDNGDDGDDGDGDDDNGDVDHENDNDDDGDDDDDDDANVMVTMMVTAMKVTMMVTAMMMTTTTMTTSTILAVSCGSGGSSGVGNDCVDRWFGAGRGNDDSHRDVPPLEVVPVHKCWAMLLSRMGSESSATFHFFVRTNRAWGGGRFHNDFRTKACRQQAEHKAAQIRSQL